MQYTGLKDKNGTEIYEYDYVVAKGEDNYSDHNMDMDEDWKFTGIIKFMEYAWFIEDVEGFPMWLGSTEIDEIEVIGNAYENPELLPTGR